MTFNTHDQVQDSPTNTFATLNNLCAFSTSQTFSDGNLQVVTHSSGYPTIPSNIAFPMGTSKWYIEILIVSTSGYDSYGILPADYNTSTNDYPGSISGSYGYLAWIGNTRNNGGSYIPYGETFGSNGNLMGLLFDAENGTLEFFKNGSSQGVAFTSISTTIKYIFGISDYDGTVSGTYVINFGQDHTFGGYPNSLASSSGYSDANGIGSFYYQPPTGALALCTANLPDPNLDPNVDDLPEDYFKAVTYDGSTSSKTIDVGFTPDLIWIKGKLSSAIQHNLFDSVRTLGAALLSNSNSQEQPPAGFTSFDSTANGDSVNGFTLPFFADTNSTSYGTKYVAWCWKAGGAPSSDGVAMVDGTATTCSALATSASASITPTRMSVNTKAGFSIIKAYTTNVQANDMTESIPHGLTQTPHFVISKPITLSHPWMVYHKNGFNGNAPNNLQGLQLNLSNPQFTNSSYKTMEITNSVIKFGRQTIEFNNNYIVFYVWHSVPGYSSFGSYKSNGLEDGPFVHTGFKPAWLMIKATSSGISSSNWMIWDNARDTYNPTDKILRANEPDIQNDGTWKIDFVSNGFKIRTLSSDHINKTNNYDYVYMAFAEQPEKYSNAR